jgi:hypothetical protein
MTESEQKWIETNNQACGLLRLAHDLLACSSLPPRRTWVGLTEDERYKLWLTTPSETEDRFAFAKAIEQALKEKNI